MEAISYSTTDVTKAKGFIEDDLKRPLVRILEDVLRL